MDIIEYFDKYGGYPYGDEDDTFFEVLHIRLCETEEEQKKELKYLKESQGEEKFEIFKEFCIAFNLLHHVFSPDGTGIGDQMIQQY